MRLLPSRSPVPTRRRTESTVVSAGLVFVAVLFAALATQGLIGLILAAAMAFYVMLLAVLGRERTALLTLMGAFATAPMYKGLAPSPGSIVTATDVLLVIGFGLLLPSLVYRRIDLPPVFIGGAILVFVTGSIASVICDDPVTSTMTLVLWLSVMVGLPFMFMAWGPDDRIVDLLAWSYVAGQTVSLLYGLGYGAGEQGRYGGLATHPNYFAQSGLIAFCLTIYLFYRHRTWVVRMIVVGAGLGCGATIYLSGSRAAMVVAAVIVLMVPVVERSAIMSFLYAICGAMVIIAIPVLIDISGESSSLGRLLGGNSSALSDQARTLGRESGLERFFDSPFLGTGLYDLFEIHNIFLEIAAAIGIFGLVGFLMVVYTFARPLFSDVPHHRLLYVAWAFVGFGATVPGFYDRSIWVPLALGAVAVMEYRHTPRLSTPMPTPATRAA